MKRSEYTELMAKIAEGGKVSRETFDEMVAFAKKAKTKRPSEDAVLETAGIKQAAVAKEGKAPKEKKAKAVKACPVTKKQDPKVEGRTCGKPTRAGGMCATHYSRLIYRAIPENAEKARQASREYAARTRAAKAAAKAEASAA